MPVAALAQGGPDASGTVWNPGTYDFVVLDPNSGGAGTTLPLSTSDQEFDVALPWAFPFYGNTYTTITVGENGGLVMAAGANLFNGNVSLPYTGSSSPDIAVFWDSIDAWNSSGGVPNGGIYTLDDQANGRFIVSWEGVATGSDVGAGSFQVHLWPDGTISMHYADTVWGNSNDLGGSATIGIQDFTGATASSGNALNVSHNTAVIVDGVTSYTFSICADADNDGFFDIACGGDDCDDAVPGTNPATPEICDDSLDQNCDGLDTVSDSDGDSSISAACGGDDCDDFEASTAPTAPELCDDGVDNDCDGNTNDIFDTDADTFDCDVDCDDGDAAVNPAATEVCADGIDNDCNGFDQSTDMDLDGSLNVLCGGDDCDDADPLVRPGYDGDADGYDSCSDCDDVDPLVNPGASAELCDGIDNDCDGLLSATRWYGDTGNSTFTGTNRGRGAAWEITADVALNSLGAAFDLPSGESLQFAIYDAGPGGASQPALVWTGSVTSSASGMSEYTVPVGYPLRAGRTYGFMYYWTLGGPYGYSSPAVRSSTPYGNEIIGLFDSSNSVAPTVFAGSTTTTDYGLAVGFADELGDLDSDGVTLCLGDCDDDNASAVPGGVEFCGDSVDNDCDGTADNVDVDGDGEAPLLCGGSDCNDGDIAVNTQAIEVCDGIDGDCDGLDDTMDTDLGPAPAPNAPETVSSSPGSAISNILAPTTDTITTTNVGVVTDVNVTIDVAHTWDSDMRIFLVGPTGVSVELSTGNGGSGENYAGTTFDDEAASSITSGSAPFSGSFRPEGSLSALDGGRAAGDWRLEITDVAGGDDGTLNSWSITVESDAPGADADLDGFIDNSLCPTIDADCDDGDASVYPGAPEICDDSIDQDCDGLDYADDADSDGYSAVACGGDDCNDSSAFVYDGTDYDGDGALACQDDCNDLDSSVAPGAAEVCADGIDQDCDGFDQGTGFDNDLDGESDCTDCNDINPAINSAATEVCGDGVDNNCSGAADDVDGDSDGGISQDCGGDDCDDADPTAYVGNGETCDGFNVDNDCDGFDDTQDLDIGSVFDPPVSMSAGVGAILDDELAPVVELVTFATGATNPIVDVNVTVDITHTWSGDLTIDLMSPAGTTVRLADRVGGSTDDFAGTIFDDSATQVITSSSGAKTGLFLPAQPLAAFIGEAIDGDWTLTVQDNAGGDEGTLNSWSVEITTGLSSDADGDGYISSVYCAGADCQDDIGTNVDAALINPGAMEICNDSIDQDCDGFDLGGDFDGDGFMTAECGGDDCDDQDLTVYPGAPEVCADTIDNDCDPNTDDIVDGDGDGFACDVDCDDALPMVNPGFPVDICNDGLDNDCDPATLDLGDADGDGVACDTDCDDTNPNIAPNLAEVLCNGLDDNCDFGATPDVADGDGDGFNCDVDCLDTDPATNPAATEIACDGIDNDCNIATEGEVDVDNDGVTCGFDCDDNQPAAFPGNTEVCNDQINNDCDVSTVDVFDNDADGVNCITDCNDGDALTHPGAPEICGDNVDQDCDNQVDEPVNDDYDLVDDDSVLVGLCNFSFPFCGGSWNELYVQSNGRVTFGFDSVEHTEDGNVFVAESPAVAWFWNDLDPGAGGTIGIEEVADTGAGASVVIRFTDVPELGVGGTANSAVVTLFDDGTANFAFGGVSMADGLIGFACDGSGLVDLVDMTDYEMLPNAWAVGTGTEGALYELFNDQTNLNDLQGEVLDLCLTAGDDADGDGWTDVCGDCDDGDNSSFPGAVELCDAVDNDCDGVVDNADIDQDGFIAVACGGDDCDDAEDTVYPGATEVCNGFDDDCDGFAETGSEDDDADGFLVCGGDCDDGDADINPDAAEVCDQIDNDCDGLTDESFVQDQDNDGVIGANCAGDDCDDTRASVYPGAPEICDLQDNDCNGEIDEIDADGDGFIDSNCGGDDCDDQDPSINPGIAEVPYDGIDNDCSDGDLVDADGDGFFGGEDGADCDDSDADINPGVDELCEDGIDNNCDGGVDLGDKDTDVPADVMCRTGCSCESSVADADGAPGVLMLLLGFAGLMGLRRRRV